MELYRRAGRGELAAALGSDLVAADDRLWRFGVPHLAQRLEANASEETLKLVDGYLAGVNEGLRVSPLPAPAFLLLRQAPRAWNRRDVFAVAALLAYQSANNADQELLRLALGERLGDEAMVLFTRDGSHRQDYPLVLPDWEASSRESKPARTYSYKGKTKLLDLLDTWAAVDALSPRGVPPLALGSNGWVVAPSRSASRLGLFAFDSHDTLGLPNLFYELHLSFADGHQLHGWSVPGLPGVINGYNERIAWGFTNIGDSQDLFLERRHPEAPLRFADGERWYEPRTEDISIAVAGGAARKLRLVHTRNGTLISDDPPIALRWTVQDLEGRSAGALLALNRALDWGSFNAALDRHAAPALNATYADVEGNIGCRTAGALPLRAAGEGLLPLRGDEPALRWRGEVPARDLPRALNPAAGFLAAANARVNPPDSYPLVGADNAARYRSARIRAVLGSRDDHTPATMAALQTDWFDGQAADLLPIMLEGLGPRPGPGIDRKVLALLAQWVREPIAAHDSSAALLFQRWYLALGRTLLVPLIGEDLYDRLCRENYVYNMAVDSMLLDQDMAGFWPGPRAEILATALRRAIDGLEGAPSSWQLAQHQTVQARHELGSIGILAGVLNTDAAPWGGGPATVGRAAYRYDQPFAVSHGATVRTVIELSSPPRAAAVMPGGQSGHFLSHHYLDQWRSWLAGELLPIRNSGSD
jgi:penicillin amidase